MPSQYGPIRDAAARGIEAAGHEPVRAEDFPAAHIKPRTACLDAVASCDGVVLLLGARYGNVTETGYSATEDEYREAVRLKKQIYLFLENVEREERQDQFVRSITGYIDDNWRKTFTTPGELEKLVEDALRVGGVLRVNKSLQQSASSRLDKAFRTQPDDIAGLTWLRIVWATLRDEAVIKPTRFRDEDFQDSMQSLAHNCVPRLLDYREGKEVRATSSFLRISQGKSWNGHGRADVVVLDLYTDGTLSVLLNITSLKEQQRNDMLSSFLHYIDPDDARKRLQQTWSFARALWHSLDEYGRHNQLLYNVALFNIGYHRFEKPPLGHGRNSFAVPRMQDPGQVFVYDEPHQIIRADLDHAETEINEIIAMLQIRFDELSK
jgi:hypothetical protein